MVNFVGEGAPLVLDSKKVEQARARIKERYSVFSEQNLDEQPPPKQAVAVQGHQ